MKPRSAAVRVAVATAVAGLGLAVVTGGIAPSLAASTPQAVVGLATTSYTAGTARFAVILSDDAGLASYDVRRSDSSMLATRRAAWSRPTTLQAVPASGTDASARLSLPIARGRVLCVSVRARGADGMVGSWSEPACAVRAVDDRSLTRYGHVRLVRDSRFWGGRATEVGSSGRLVLRGVPAGSRVVVIATDLNQNNPRLNGRNVPFTVPSARSVRTYDAGWRWGPTRYTQATVAGRTSGRWGSVVIRHSGYPVASGPGWTSPFEGVAIVPHWL